MVAFMPWKGYNFEDAIVISEKLFVKMCFTSIHIDEYLLEVRDTKRGLEELTLIFQMLVKRQRKTLMKTVLFELELNIKKEIFLLERLLLKENQILHLKKNCFVQSLVIKLVMLKMLL
jgi:DNA-directed RNA polymerase subunit beta